jgi:hypothetical protein
MQSRKKGPAAVQSEAQRARRKGLPGLTEDLGLTEDEGRNQPGDSRLQRNAAVALGRLWHAVPSRPTISEIWLRLLAAYSL